MRVSVFLNGLGLGGTEKAACRWATGLQERGHAVEVLSLEEGPRRVGLQRAGVSVRILPQSITEVADALAQWKPDLVHSHAPGLPHQGDILGEALTLLSKIPVVQTNIFGRLQNPLEERWTDYRIFISWTSCVQAASRARRRIDLDFFRNASVVSYPIDPDDRPIIEDRVAFRDAHAVRDNEVLFGRISRPEANKWTDLPLEAFLRACHKNPNVRLLLREPPEEVTRRIQKLPVRERIIVLAATSDPDELRRTIAALDVVLHTSSIGESFGYGIAEPMNLAKPVIANSTPWADQAQIELVRDGECGFIASTPVSVANAMVRLSAEPELRTSMGKRAQNHIRNLAGASTSLERLEGIMEAAARGSDNPLAREDLAQARRAAEYLDRHQFGSSFRDQLALRPFHYRVRFSEWRRAFTQRLSRRITGCLDHQRQDVD